MTETEQQIACWEWMGWYRLPDEKVNEPTWAPKGWVYGKDSYGKLRALSQLPLLTLYTLQPMLEKMTEEQWAGFSTYLIDDLGGDYSLSGTVKKLLTCPLPILVKRFMLTVGIWK